jgi:hypothetical protein
MSRLFFMSCYILFVHSFNTLAFEPILRMTHFQAQDQRKSMEFAERLAEAQGVIQEVNIPATVEFFKLHEQHHRKQKI